MSTAGAHVVRFCSCIACPKKSLNKRFTSESGEVLRKDSQRSRLAIKLNLHEIYNNTIIKYAHIIVKYKMIFFSFAISIVVLITYNDLWNHYRDCAFLFLIGANPFECRTAS